MGGRGASSSTLKTVHPGGGGGGGGDDLNFSNGLGFPNYETKEAALGTKGKPMGMAEAAINANPHYDRTGTFAEFTANCQRCVVANEARRRGYDVTAQPTYRGDRMPYGDNWSKAFENPTVNHISGTKAQARRQVETQMASSGNGTRAVMTFVWQGERRGHAISLEYRNGKVHYLDPQLGGKYIASQLYDQINPRTVTLTRVDNLKFADETRFAVTKDKW